MKIIMEGWNEFDCPFKELDRDFTCKLSGESCELVDDYESKECTYCIDFDELMRQRKEIENE